MKFKKGGNSFDNTMDKLLYTLESLTRTKTAHFEMCVLYTNLFFKSAQTAKYPYQSESNEPLSYVAIYCFEHDAARLIEALSSDGVKSMSMVPPPPDFQVRLDPRLFTTEMPNGALLTVSDEFGRITDRVLQFEPTFKSRFSLEDSKRNARDTGTVKESLLRHIGHQFKVAHFLRDLSLEQNPQGIHNLVRKGQLAKVKIRLNAGTKVDEISAASLWTSLQYAAAYGHRKIVRLLLQYGAKLWFTDHAATPALHLAAAAGHVDILQMLHQHDQQNPCSDSKSQHTADKVNPYADKMESHSAWLDNHKAYPIHYACATGQIKCLKYLIQATPEHIKAATMHGDTPLHYACTFGQLEAVQLLLAAGADPHAKNKEGHTPLLALANNNVVKRCVESITLHTRHPQHAHFPDVSLSTLDKIVELLKQHKADLKACDSQGNNALMICIKNLNPGAFEVFLKHGINPNQLNNDKASPLIASIEQGLISVAQTLLKHPDVDLQQRGPRGLTALFYAVMTGDVGLVKSCVEAGLDVNDQKNEIQSTPLIRACIYASKWSAYTLRKKYEAGELNTAQYTPQSFKFCQVVEYLLKKGAAVEARDQRAYTPLLHAADGGCYEICELLLQHGADVNAQEPHDQHTSLHVISFMGLSYGQPQRWFSLPSHETSIAPAVSQMFHNSPKAQPYLKTVQVLIRHGADMLIKDKEGNTPIMLAYGIHGPTKEIKDCLTQAAIEQCKKEEANEDKEKASKKASKATPQPESNAPL